MPVRAMWWTPGGNNKGRVVDRRPPRGRHPATHRCQAGQPERPPHRSISALAELIDMLMLRTGVVAETSGTAASTDHG